MKFNMKKYLESNEFKLIALILVISLIIQQLLGILTPLIFTVTDPTVQVVDEDYIHEQFFVWTNHIKSNVIGNVLFTVLLFVFSVVIAKLLERFI